MRHKPTILIVEDETVISDFISALLIANNYSVIQAVDAKEAMELAASHNPSLVLLDLGLPDQDGLTVIQDIRSWSSMPILVVSARQLEKEKVEALDAGADDYITKPFGNSELLARIRSALRRGRYDKPLLTGTFEVKDLVLDYERHSVTMAGEAVHLTATEYKILALLAQNAGRVMTHDAIIREVWGPYASDPQVLRVNMANIRRKLEENPADPEYLLTEVGVGYRMIDTIDLAETEAAKASSK